MTFFFVLLIIPKPIKVSRQNEENFNATQEISVRPEDLRFRHRPFNILQGRKIAPSNTKGRSVM